MIYIFIPNVKSLRMCLMHVQLETRCKYLTTFRNRLFPSVLKTADDFMQSVIVSQSPSHLLYFVSGFGVSSASASEIQPLGLAFCCGHSVFYCLLFSSCFRSYSLYYYYYYFLISTVFSLM